MFFARDRVDVGVGVWPLKKRWIQKSPLRVRELGVDFAGDEEVYPIAQVADEADFVDEARGGGDEDQGGNATCLG